MNREAAVIIGLVATAIAAAVEQLSGPGIFTDNAGETALNVLTIITPLIASVVTRFQVYSKQTVADITGAPVEALPPPP
jgi:hypothetical protein